ADDRGKERCHQSGKQQGNPDGDGKLGKQRQSVSADSEESDVAQRELSCITAHQVPGQPEAGEQRNAEKHLQLVVIADEPGHARPDTRRQQQRPELPILEDAHARCLPKIPLGLKERTSRKKMKSTINAHWLPAYRLVRLSERPSTRPPKAAPSIEPMPPSTTITKALVV